MGIVKYEVTESSEKIATVLEDFHHFKYLFIKLIWTINKWRIRTNLRGATHTAGSGESPPCFKTQCFDDVLAAFGTENGDLEWPPIHLTGVLGSLSWMVPTFQDLQCGREISVLFPGRPWHIAPPLWLQYRPGFLKQPCSDFRIFLQIRIYPF